MIFYFLILSLAVDMSLFHIHVINVLTLSEHGESELQRLLVAIASHHLLLTVRCVHLFDKSEKQGNTATNCKTNIKLSQTVCNTKIHIS